MSDGVLKIGGFGLLTQNLQDKNIDASEEELNLLFSGALEENKSESLTADSFAQTIAEKYGLEDNEDILNILIQISQNDGKEDDLSFDDFELQYQKENSYTAAVNAENAIINFNTIPQETQKIYADFFRIDSSELASQMLDETSYCSRLFSIANSLSNNDGANVDSEAIQDFTIYSLHEIYANLDRIFDNQLDNEGVISNIWNYINETFGFSVSREDMQAALELQKENIMLLMKAHDGDLTQEDIINQYKNIIRINPNYSTVLDKLDNIPFETLQQMAFGQIDSNQVTINDEPIQYSAEAINFENAFSFLYGKEYNPKEILDYSQNYSNYLAVQDGVKQIEQVSALIMQCNTYDEAMYYFKQLYGNKAEEYMQEYMQTATSNANYPFGTYEQPDYESWGEIMIQDNSKFSRYIKSLDSFENEYPALTNEQQSLLIDGLNSAKSYDNLLTTYNEFFGEESGSILLNKFICNYWADNKIQENPMIIDEFTYINLYANQESDFFVDKFNNELIDTTGKSIEQYQDEYTTSYAVAFTEFDETKSDLNSYISAQQKAVGMTKGIVTAAALITATCTGGGSLALLPAIGIGAGTQTAVGLLEQGTSENGVTLQGVSGDALNGGITGLTFFSTTSLWKGIYSKLAGSKAIISWPGTKLAPQGANLQVTPKFATQNIFGGIGFGTMGNTPILAVYMTPTGASVVANIATGVLTNGASGSINYLLNSEDPTFNGFLGAGIGSAEAGAYSAGFMSMLTTKIQQLISQTRIQYNPAYAIDASDNSTVLPTLGNQSNMLAAQEAQMLPSVVSANSAAALAQAEIIDVPPITIAANSNGIQVEPITQPQTEGTIGANNTELINYQEAIDEKIAEGILDSNEVKAIQTLRKNGIPDDKIFEIMDKSSNPNNSALIKLAGLNTETLIKLNEIDSKGICFKNAIILLNQGFDIDMDILTSLRKLDELNFDLTKLKYNGDELTKACTVITSLVQGKLTKLTIKAINSITNKILSINTDLNNEDIVKIGEVLSQYLFTTNNKFKIEDLTDPDFVRKHFGLEGNETLKDKILNELGFACPNEIVESLISTLKYNYSDAIWYKMSPEQQQTCRDLGWGDNGQALIAHLYGKQIENPVRYSELTKGINKVFGSQDTEKITINLCVGEELNESIERFGNDVNIIKSEIEKAVKDNEYITRANGNQAQEGQINGYPCFIETCTNANGVKYTWYVIGYSENTGKNSPMLVIAMHDNKIDTVMINKKRNCKNFNSEHGY